jgi:predicted component of type VI protein secretion system
VDHARSKSFLEATGGRALKFVVRDLTKLESTQVELSLPFAVIGRGSDADLCLNHWQVSRRHLYFQSLDEGVFWIDLASRTGVQFNGVTQTLGWITPDDVIRIGTFELRLSADMGGGSPTKIPPALPLLNATVESDLPTIRLEFPSTKKAIPQWSVQARVVLVGRSPRCKIRINAPDVSGFHCALIRTRLGLWVVDLLGRETRVNQAIVRFARLESNDELRVGHHQLRVFYDVPPPPIEVERAMTLNPMLPARIATKVIQREDPADMLMRLVEGRPPEQVELAEALIVPLVQQFSQMQQDMMEQFHQSMIGMFSAFGSLYQEQMGDLKKELGEIRQLTTELKKLQVAASIAAPEPTSTGGQNGASKPAPVGPPNPHALADANIRGTETGPSQGSVQADATNSADIHAMLTQRIAALQTERQGRLQRIMQMIIGEG